MRTLPLVLFLVIASHGFSLDGNVLESFRRDFPEVEAEDAAAVLDHYFLGDLAPIYHPFVVSSTIGPMAVHRFAGGPNSVVLVHGYMEHSLAKYRMIRALVAAGFTVYALDLPGHGFSAGERGDVPSFGFYADVLDDLVARVRAETTGNVHFLGHSTGCSMMMEWLGRGGRIDGRIIFAAPLVRSAEWGFTTFSVGALGWAMPRVPRVLRDHSHDKAHMRFIAKDDPLQIWSVPIHWVRALQTWEKSFLTGETVDEAVHVIQGTGDRVVDWRYNLPALRERFPFGTTLLVDGARHNLLTEGEGYREQVYERILGLLGQG